MRVMNAALSQLVALTPQVDDRDTGDFVGDGTAGMRKWAVAARLGFSSLNRKFQSEHTLHWKNRIIKFS
jgi:hypothetical protein